MMFIKKETNLEKDKKQSSAAKSSSLILETLDSILQRDSWAGFILDKVDYTYNYLKESLIWKGRANAFELYKKFNTEVDGMVKLCLIVKLRGNKISSILKDPTLSPIMTDLISKFNIAYKKEDRGNRIEVLMQAFAPVMLIVSEYCESKLDFGLTERDSKLALGYRWFGSICAMPFEVAKVEIKNYIDWTEAYIAARRREGVTLTADQKANNNNRRTADKSYLWRSYVIYSEETKLAWTKGQTVKVEAGGKQSLNELRTLSETVGMNVNAQLNLKNGESLSEEQKKKIEVASISI